MITALEFAELEPHIAFDSDYSAAYSANDGALDPILASQMLLDAAERLGATIQYPSEVVGTSLSAGRLTAVETTSGSIKADRLVLATGAALDLPKRIAGIDIPQRATPGIIAITQPIPRLLNHVIAAPGIHMHQRADGRIVIGEQDGAPDNDPHAARLKERPNDFPVKAIAQQHGNRMLEIAKKFVPDMANAVIDEAFIGWRPLPLDGHPVLGTSPVRSDVYLAITHSGVTLAPIIGEVVAQEILEEVKLQKLEPYRPTRTFQKVKRY